MSRKQTRQEKAKHQPMDKRNDYCHQYAGKDDVAQEMAALSDANEADHAAGENGQSHKRCPPAARHHSDSKSKCVNGGTPRRSRMSSSDGIALSGIRA